MVSNQYLLACKINSYYCAEGFLKANPDICLTYFCLFAQKILVVSGIRTCIFGEQGEETDR